MKKKSLKNLVQRKQMNPYQFEFRTEAHFLTATNSQTSEIRKNVIFVCANLFIEC